MRVSTIQLKHDMVLDLCVTVLCAGQIEAYLAWCWWCGIADVTHEAAGNVSE